MDISSLTSNYTDYITTTAATTEAEKNLDTALSTDQSTATDEKLMDVCKQFESYFLEQVFKEMKKTIPEEEYSSSSVSSRLDYFEDQAIQTLATQSTDKNSLGIAQMLYEQMKRNYDI